MKTNIREYINQKLQEAFGQDYIGTVNDKTYIWAPDDDSKTQIAISLACPRTPIEVINTAQLDYDSEGIDFEAVGKKVLIDNNKLKFSPQEQETLDILIKKLKL